MSRTFFSSMASCSRSVRHTTSNGSIIDARIGLPATITRTASSQRAQPPAELQAKALQQPAHAVLDVLLPPHQRRASREQRALLACRDGLHVHRPEPTGTQQLRHATGIVAIGLGDHGQKAGANVRLRDISFGYSAEKRVLHDVNLHFPRGTISAIVGPSGAGKSSLLRLITRMEEPDSGRVFLDGTQILSRGQDQASGISGAVARG